MDNTKSVELEIRAQDLTGKTISDLRKNIKKLKDDLESQAKAAKDGKADFKKYADGLKDLANEANKLSNLSAIVAKLDKMGKTLDEQNGKVREAAKKYTDLANEIGKLGVPTKKQAEQLFKLQNAHEKAAAMADKAANAYARQRMEAEAYGISTKNVKQSQEALEKTYQRTLQKLIDMRQAQAALQKQQDMAIKQAQVKAKNERNYFDKNNAALRNNLEVWKQQKAAIEAAKKALADKAAAKAAEAHKLEQLKLKYTIERNVKAMRDQRKAAELARKAAAKAQTQRATDYANQQAAAQKVAAQQAAEAAKEAARKQKELREQILKTLEAHRKQQEAIKKARHEAQKAAHERKVAAQQAIQLANQQAAANAAKEAARKQKELREQLLANLALHRKQQEAIKKARHEAQKAAHERKVAAQQAAAEAQRAIQLANQQAAAEAAKQRAIQAGLQAQRNQINAQRKSIQQQIAAAQTAYNNQQNKSTDRIAVALNPNKSTDGAMRQITTSVRNAQKAYRDQQATVDSLTIATNRLKAAQEQMLAVARNIDAYRKQQNELSRLKAEYGAVVSEYTRLNNAMRNGATPEQIARLSQLQAKLNEVGAAYARQRVQVQAQEASLKRAGVDTNNLAAAENRLAQNAARSSTTLTSLSQRLNEVARNSRKGSDELRKFANSTRTALGFVQRLKGQLIALTATYMGLNGAIDLFNKTIQAGKDGQVLKIRTEVLADGWEGAVASELEKYFKGTAERMGLELRDVIQDASRLFVGGKENGLDLQTSKFIYEQFAGLGQLMGLDAEQQKGITVALSQMLSKTTVQAEELRGQLGDRLPQAQALFTKALGVTNEELNKMMKNNEVISNEALPKVAKVIQEQYGAQMDKMYDSISANQSRLNNAFQEWLRIIANAGVMDNFKQLLKELASWFRSDEGKQWALNIAWAINQVINALRWAVQHVNQLAIALGALVAIGFAQVLAMIVVSLNFMAKNLALVGSVITRTAARLGILSNQAKALFILASTKFKNGNYLSALAVSANGLLVVLGALFKRFIVIEVIVAVIKGIAQGFENATGKTLEFSDALSTIGDVFAVVGDIIADVFKLIEITAEAITTIVANLVELVVYWYKDLTGQSTQAANESGKAWLDMFADTEGRSISFARKIARMFDALKWSAKSAAIYAGGWIDWAMKKLSGQTAEMPEWAKIAEDVAKDIAENGSEAKIAQRELKRLQERKLIEGEKAAKTEMPEIKNQPKKVDEEKLAQERAKADEQIEKARERAEEARKKAEEAALRRLEKQMSYEKLLAQRIRIREGKEQEVIGKGQSLRDWYMGQFEGVRQQYAAPRDKYAGYKAESDKGADIPRGSNGTSNVDTSKYQTQEFKNVHDKASRAAEIALNQTARKLNGQVKAVTAYTGKCARYVNDAFRKVGVRMGGHGADVARNAIRSGQGFQEVKYSANYVPQKGDIMSLPRGFGQSASYGHVAIFDGSKWVSDAVQRVRGNTAATNDTSWANIRSGRSVPTIARYTGKNGGVIQSNGDKPVPVTVKGSSGVGVVKKGLSEKDQVVLNHYKAQEAAWKSMNADGKAEANDDRREEKFDEFINEIRDNAKKSKTDFYEKMGVAGVEGLINRDPSKLSLDLSDSTLDEIFDGFKDVKQAGIDEKVKMMLEELTIDYHQSRGGSWEAAMEWSKNLEPQLRKYAELQAQKGVREQADAFIEAINDKQERWEKERSNRMSELSSRVARGETSGTVAKDEVIKINNTFIERMNALITKFDEVISSPNFQNLSSEQQAAVLKAREDVIAQRQDPSKSGGRQAADAAVEAMTAKLQQAQQEQIDYEKMLDAQVQAGMISMAEHYEKLQTYIQGNKQGMTELIEKARELMISLGDTASAEKLAALAETIGKVEKSAGRTQTQVEFMNAANQKMQEGAMLAMETMAQGVAGLITGQMDYKEALAMTGQAMAQWAAETLMHLAKVIMQQIILNAVSSMFGGAKGGMGVAGGAVTSFGGMVRHTGGMADMQGLRRPINPLVFVGATRYHSGGIAGLAPNEVPAILQKGEEVLTKQDPRHRNNAGKNSSSKNNQLTVINSFDPVEAQKLALSSLRGRKVLVQAASNERKVFGGR